MTKQYYNFKYLINVERCLVSSTNMYFCPGEFLSTLNDFLKTLPMEHAIQKVLPSQRTT